MNIRKVVDYSAMFAALETVMDADLPQMELYCEAGKIICARLEKGAAVSAAEFLKERYPDMTGFAQDSSCTSAPACEAVRRAVVVYCAPDIIMTDRGTQFTGRGFHDMMQDLMISGTVCHVRTARRATAHPRQRSGHFRIVFFAQNVVPPSVKQNVAISKDSFSC